MGPEPAPGTQRHRNPCPLPDSRGLIRPPTTGQEQRQACPTAGGRAPEVSSQIPAPLAAEGEQLTPAVRLRVHKGDRTTHVTVRFQARLRGARGASSRRLGVSLLKDRDSRRHTPRLKRKQNEGGARGDGTGFPQLGDYGACSHQESQSPLEVTDQGQRSPAESSASCPGATQEPRPQREDSTGSSPRTAARQMTS